MRKDCLKDVQSIHSSRLIHLFIHPMFIIKNLLCVLDSRDEIVNKTDKKINKRALEFTF